MTDFPMHTRIEPISNLLFQLKIFRSSGGPVKPADSVTDTGALLQNGLQPGQNLFYKSAGAVSTFLAPRFSKSSMCTALTSTTP